MMPFALAAEMSALRSAGPQAAHIEWIWWLMFWVTGVVYVIVMGFYFVAVFRHKGDNEVHPELERKLTAWVIGGTVVSSVILLGLLVASVIVGRSTSELSTENAIKIKLTGQQWWWQAE